ncbi:Detected protein of confused Function [Hibiscus syriacus]|uniref:Detected protein of confused Function n=1 Tax=Hibiscus syriacus TaxID=106335 RepID=A0A6A3CU80_HIBSY|nr:Detected protein of confused Function [Hibiscus syriacus]
MLWLKWFCFELEFFGAANDRKIREEVRSNSLGFITGWREVASLDLLALVTFHIPTWDTLMDYDNDLQSPNLHLAGEGNNKFPPVLCPYALPRFDFDDNLHGHLRFDSLAETEVFLCIESSEDNQWIEDFSGGALGLHLVRVQLNLVQFLGQDESILSQTIRKDSDACDELGGGEIKLMEPSLKPEDSDLTEVGDALQPASQTGEIPGKLYGLKGDVSGDQLVDSVSQAQESKAPNTSNTDLSVRHESKDGEQIVVNENKVEASVDQSMDKREQVDKFASVSQIDILVTSVQNTCESSKDSYACDELGNIIKQMEPSLKHGDSDLSEVGDGLQSSLRTNEIPEKFSGLKGDVSGDNLLVQYVSPPREFDSSVDGTLKVPNTRNIDVPEGDESKDENQVEASVDQFVDNGEHLDKFASGSQVDTSISSVQNTCASSAFLESQDTTHLKNDTVDENVDIASFTSDLQKHSVSNMQSREDERIVGNITPTVAKPSDRTLKENSNLRMVEECSEGLGVESPLPTGISNANVLSVGKLHDVSPLSFFGDTTIKEQENEISNIDTQIYVGGESKLDNLDSMEQITYDATEKKDLSESDCQSDTKILNSKSEKYLSSVEDGIGSKGEGDGAHNTLGAEPARVDEDFIVTEHTDDSTFEQSVSAAEKQNTKLPSHCIKTDLGQCGSLIVIKGVDSSSFGTGDTTNELASNLLPDVAISCKSVDCMLFPSGENLPAAAVSDQKDAQVSSPEASFSTIKTSEISTEGAPCETGGQSSCKKDYQPLSTDDTSNAVGQNGEQTLLGVTLESKDMNASSIVSDSTVRETYGAEAQVISMGSSGPSVTVYHEAHVLAFLLFKASKDNVHYNKIPSGAVSIQDKNHTLTNLVPSISKQLFRNADQKHPEDSDTKLSQEFSGHIVAHHADGDNTNTHNSSFSSPPSSESQTKTHVKEFGSSADLDNPSCESPILIRTSEKPESKTRANTVKGSKDLSASVSGVISEEANKGHTNSQDTKGNDAFSGDINFAFVVLPMANLSENEAGRNWQPFPSAQHDKISLVSDAFLKWLYLTYTCSLTLLCSYNKKVGERTPSTSGSTKVGPETAEEVSHSNLQTSKRENVSDGSKVTSARRTRRAGSKSMGKETAKKGIVAKDMTPARQSERSGKTSNASLSTAENDQLVKSNEMQHSGHMEGVFHQPFTDSQQVQLRAQIFVYGALISQGTAPDEAYMISAFGGPDGRTIWEKAWRACTDRVRCQNPHLVSPETPLQAHIGAKTPDQSIKQNALQTKIASLPASQSNRRGTPTTIGKPMIPLSSPLWTIPTPSSDAVQPTSIPRGAVVDYQHTLSPLHSPVRNFVGHYAPWVSQSPFCASRVPHSSAFDSNAHFPVLPITETSGGPANVFVGAPLLDNKKATSRSSQSSADPKPRKRKKSVSEDHGQIILHSQAEPVLATIVNSHVSTPASITTPDNFITSVSADHIKKDDRNSDQKATLSGETLGKLKEAQKQAEDAGALASAAVSHTQEIWNQLETQKKSVLAPDVETKLTSAVVTIAAAAAVAKAAAAAASVASNAALQAKLMAVEAWVSSGYRNPTPTNTISFDSVNLGKATPASILRDAGPETYWKVPHASSEPDDAVREHTDKVGNVEALGSVSEHPQEVHTDKSEKQSSNHEVSPILRDMDIRSIQYHSRLTDGTLGAAATSGNDKRVCKASDIAKSKGVSTKTEHGKEERTLKDRNMREGSHVEVLRDGGGSKVAWFPTDILDLKDGKAYVCYHELRSEDGDRLKEWVELEVERDKEPRIRSSRPITVMPFERTRKRCRAATGDYNWSIGDRVDAWMQDSWWEGVISERSKKDETSYTVRFPTQGETSVVKAWLLRPSLVWKNGRYPTAKRPRIRSPVVDTKEEGTKGFDNEESKKPDDTTLLDLPVLKPGKPPSVSSRTIPQKDILSSNLGSEPDDVDSISGEHNTEFRSFSSSDGAGEGPVLFSSVAVSSDAPREKASISNAKSERISKGKLAPASGKLAKVEEKTKRVSDAVERRKSNRKIQPTSRLLEGLQSSLLISKVPVPHDKVHKVLVIVKCAPTDGCNITVSSI